MGKTIAAVVATLALCAYAATGDHSSASPQTKAARETPLHQGGYLNSYIALLKSDLKARKQGFITEGLRLNEKQSAAFWPIYRSYEADLRKLEDERDKVVKEYAEHHEAISDRTARQLIQRRFDLEERRVSLEREYFKRLEKVLPGKTVARFFQLDYRYSLMLNLKSTADIPLIE